MGKFQQYLTGVACSLSSLVMGLLNVWPSYTISLYTAHNTTLLTEPMSEVHSSLLGSLPSLGAMVGTAVSSLIIDRIGRKNGGIVITLPYVLCWAIKQVSNSTFFILGARFIGGIAGGAALVYAPIFISEIAESSIRGTLAAAPIMFYCLGALLSYIIGWTCNYQTIVCINLVGSIFCALFFTLIVESPVYLLKNNRDEEALDAIAIYRGEDKSSKVVLEELSRLKQQILPAVAMITVSTNDGDNEKLADPESEKLNDNEIVYGDNTDVPAWKLLLVSPSSRKAMSVVGVTLTLQVFMGMVTVQVYAKDLFGKAAPDLSSHLCSVLFALVMLSGSAFTAVFADKAGRRLLIISSCLLTSVCMAALAVLLQTQIAPPWVAAVVVLLYCFTFVYGAGTVPYVLLAECFNSKVQGIASMLLVEWVWFLNFFIIAVFPFIVSILSLSGVFYIYAAVSFVNCIISYRLVPETKGLTLDEIQDTLAGRSVKY